MASKPASKHRLGQWDDKVLGLELRCPVYLETCLQGQELVVGVKQVHKLPDERPRLSAVARALLKLVGDGVPDLGVVEGRQP